MKIATFNVNGITSRLKQLLQWLEESKPDIVCLQELKTSDATFPELAIQGVVYEASETGGRAIRGFGSIICC